MREIVQTARLRQGPKAFIERLHWHCHFIQKLESQPSLEYQNAHRAYDGLRADDPQRLAIWIGGAPAGHLWTPVCEPCGITAGSFPHAGHADVGGQLPALAAMAPER